MGWTFVTGAEGSPVPVRKSFCSSTARSAASTTTCAATSSSCAARTTCSATSGPASSRAFTSDSIELGGGSPGPGEGSGSAGASAAVGFEGAWFGTGSMGRRLLTRVRWPRSGHGSARSAGNSLGFLLEFSQRGADDHARRLTLDEAGQRDRHVDREIVGEAGAGSLRLEPVPAVKLAQLVALHQLPGERVGGVAVVVLEDVVDALAEARDPVLHAGSSPGGVPVEHRDFLHVPGPVRVSLEVDRHREAAVGRRRDGRVLVCLVGHAAIEASRAQTRNPALSAGPGGAGTPRGVPPTGR